MWQKGSTLLEAALVRASRGAATDITVPLGRLPEHLALSVAGDEDRELRVPGTRAGVEMDRLRVTGAGAIGPRARAASPSAAIWRYADIATLGLGAADATSRSALVRHGDRSVGEAGDRKARRDRGERGAANDVLARRPLVRRRAVAVERHEKTTRRHAERSRRRGETVDDHRCCPDGCTHACCNGSFEDRASTNRSRVPPIRVGGAGLFVAHTGPPSLSRRVKAAPTKWISGLCSSLPPAWSPRLRTGGVGSFPKPR